MPTSPDSASCRRTSPGMRMGRGLCQAVGPGAAPALGQSPPSPAGPKPAQEQQGRRGSPGAASWEKLLIQGTGEPGDCGQLRAGQRTRARIRAAGSPRGTRGLPGSCPHPTYAAGRAPRRLAREQGRAARSPAPSPLQHPTHPSLPAAAQTCSGFVQKRVASMRTLDSLPHRSGGPPSLTESPWGNPWDSPTMHRGSHGQRVGEQRGYTPLGPAANSASRELYGPGRAGLCRTPPRAAPAPDSPRSRPRTGRNAGSWWRA